MILYKSIIEYVFDFLKGDVKKFDQMNYVVAAFLDEELGRHGDQIDSLMTSIDKNQKKLNTFQGSSGNQMKEIKMDVELLSKEVLNISSALQEEINTQRENQEATNHSIAQIKKQLDISEQGAEEENKDNANNFVGKQDLILKQLSAIQELLAQKESAPK